MKNVIVYDGVAVDPVCRAVMAEPVEGVEVVNLLPFMRGMGCTLDEEAGRMSIPSEPEEMKVLDRVVEVGPETVDDFGRNVTFLSRGHVQECYARVLADVDGTSRRGLYSTVGTLVPLPTQWALVERAGLPVLIPEFRHAYGPVQIDAEGFERPIYKSPYDLYGWRPNEAPKGRTYDQLIVERPAGEAIVGWAFGDEVRCTAPDGGPAADPAAAEAVAQLMPSVLRVFGAAIGEALWFAEPGEAPTFASFSHSFYGAKGAVEFPALARGYVARHFGE